MKLSRILPYSSVRMKLICVKRLNTSISLFVSENYQRQKSWAKKIAKAYKQNCLHTILVFNVFISYFVYCDQNRLGTQRLHYLDFIVFTITYVHVVRTSDRRTWRKRKLILWNELTFLNQQKIIQQGPFCCCCSNMGKRVMTISNPKVETENVC